MAQATYILGISAFYHDSAAALLKDGEIVAAAQEERFTRKKYDASFPQRAVQFCLDLAKIRMQDLSHVVFYEKPFLKFDRILNTYLATAPFGLRSFLAAMPLWLREKIFLKDQIKTKLGFTGEILFPSHHESHAAAAFFPSPFAESAILTMDGVGEWATMAYGWGKGNKLALCSELNFPHSLGLLYSAFTTFCGFKVCSGEYKLMGLAPLGEPRYVDLIKQKLVDIKEDGSFKLNMAYFNYPAGLTMTNSKFNRLFGGLPRQPETTITKREMDMAASIQKVTEEIVLKLARFVRKATNQKNLCLGGGVALNCVANGKILEEGLFENVWVQPAAGDAGSALGAALMIWHHYLGKARDADERNDRQKGSFLGPSFSDDQIERVLRQNNAVYERMDAVSLLQKAAELIKAGRVIGWFQGRMEFGPRALGSRSILADARLKTMQSLLNEKIKLRETFRPFAPSVLGERAGDYFDLPAGARSPYMLFVAQVKKGKDLPAITHVDRSARIQTVSRVDNSMFYDLLSAFEKLTGCAVVINTSFNVRGEPIVCTPQEALDGFMRTDMDHLFIGNFFLDKKDQMRLKNAKTPLVHFEAD